MRAGRGLGLLLPLAALALLPACGRERPARNLVVVLVDTLRADHLDLYGYARATAPGLARRAGASGVVFENARAQAPCTFPSVNSLLTSRTPEIFYARGVTGELGIPATLPTLAERLAAAGFATAAVSASPVVRATPSRENPTAGFGAGFERFDEFCLWREAACVSTRAREIVRELDEPFLLYLHYMDPHDPYRPAADLGGGEPFAAAGPPPPGRDFVGAGDPTPVAAHLYAGAPDPALTPAELAHWVDLYDDEIRAWDAAFEPLADELRRRFPRTAFVFLSDHGEEFLEHGHVKHCRTLYDTEIRVPLVLFAPGLAARRSAVPAMNLDLVPTALDLLGVELTGSGVDGVSLLPLLDERARAGLPERPQIATNGRFWAAVGGGFKLILEPAAQRAESYDLGADPGELRPLAALPAEIQPLRRRLAEWRRLSRGRAERGAEEAERRLRSVGYLQ